MIGEVEKTIELPEEVQAPIQKGECAGRVVYKADGEELGSVAILYGADVARAGMWDLFGCTMKQYFLGTHKAGVSCAKRRKTWQRKITMR